MPSMRNAACFAAGFMVASGYWCTRQQFSPTSPTPKHGGPRLKATKKALLKAAKKALKVKPPVGGQVPDGMHSAANDVVVPDPNVLPEVSSSQSLPHVEDMCHSETSTLQKHAEPDGSRCVFIDTFASGHIIEHFHIYTPFRAMSCAWEVWALGRSSAGKDSSKKSYGTLHRLESVAGITMRYLPNASRLGFFASHQGDLNLTLEEVEANLDKHAWHSTVASEAEDVILLMLANLRREDYITVALHPDNKVKYTHALELVKRMGRFGVASWVDRWLVSTAAYHAYRMPDLLLKALHQEIPDLRSFPPYGDPQNFRASHEVTYLLYRPTSKYLQPGAKLSSGSAHGNTNRQVYIDFGMNKCDTIFMFLTLVPDPQNWQVWGFEAVPSIIEQAVPICQWIEQHYPLSLSPNEVNDTYGLRRISIMHAAAWVQNTELNFHTGESLSGSIFHKNYGIRGPVQMTPAIDVAQWVRTKYSSDDYIFVKMDIEGAEYPVLRHMLLDGIACWVGQWALEFHRLSRFRSLPLPPKQCEEVKAAFVNFTAAQGITAGVLDRRLVSV